MYEQDWKVRFSECDSERRLTYDGIVNYFQDCSNLESESNRAGIHSLNEKNRAWILDFWQIVINERPMSFEEIKIATWPNGFRGFFGTRNFLMRTKNDDVLAYANSYWVYLDAMTGRPVKVTQDELDNYEVETPYEMDYVDRKIKVPGSLEYQEDVVVQSHHMDLYKHMNNANYIQIASDYIPEGAKVWQICCQYKKQAREKDVLKVYCNLSEEQVVVVLKDTEDGIFAIISFDIK